MGETLRFHASRVLADFDDDGFSGLSLEIEDERESVPPWYFGLVQQEPDPGEDPRRLVSVAWGDGRGGRDAVVLRIASAAIEQGRFTLVFEDPTPENTGPYDRVDITFDDIPDGELAIARRAIERCFAGRPPVLPPTIPEAPVLALVPGEAEWRVGTWRRADLAVTLTNAGGELDGDVVFELGGEALDRLGACALVLGERTATFARDGGVARATVRDVRMAAAGTVAVRVRVSGRQVGAARLTLRVWEKGADPRDAAACARTLVVEP